MAVARKVRRVANPRRRRSSPRKLTRKQVLAGFGGKRRKAAAKSSTRRRRRKSSTRKSNPSLLLTLGAVNPRRSNMARRRRKTRNPRRRRRNASVTRRYTRSSRSVTRRNPRRRRRNAATYRRRTIRRRRNPFGGGASTMAQSILGGLIGVAATKFLPTAIPTGNIGSSNVGRTVLSILAALAAGYAATRVVNKTFGEAVTFGGLMQAASVGMNSFLPGIGRQLALSGLSPAQNFYAPQNFMAAGPAPAVVSANGLRRAWPSAF